MQSAIEVVTLGYAKEAQLQKESKPNEKYEITTKQI